ncbi:hypothetical protein BGZ70_002752 [Mortierella alpina]|uniref:FAD/NAD(P)-binding domain-containing protein n=1 Tax=Mortierella alpina TaxID=64518 RepID=A0A9P6IVA2_MORAP|nr:hypothetical protein BGZ70_002752 [Mortierella alpina]
MGLTKTYKDGSTPTIAIIGAGMSGLCAAIRLQTQLNLKTYTIFELEPELGGTWWVNTYPGCACDVKSVNYEFSFEPNYDWSKTYAGQQEILEYMRHVAQKHELHKKIQFQTKITHVEWHQDLQKWVLDWTKTGTGETGQTKADVVFSGTGPLRTLEFYQRTPSYVIPRNNDSTSGLMKFLFRHVPLLFWINKKLAYWTSEFFLYYVFSYKWRHALQRSLAMLGAWFVRYWNVRDKTLRQKLTPNYPIGCRRVVVSSDYLPALTRKNVNVHTEAITGVKGHSIILEDGSVQEVDALVLATGFKVQDMLDQGFLIGRGGCDVSKVWGIDPQTYFGLTSAETPNFFFLLGPHSALGHNSVLYMIETQVEFGIRALSHMMRHDLSSIQVTNGACKAFGDEMEAKMKDMVWSSHCRSWYQNEKGKVTALWWGTCSEYDWRLRKYRVQDFVEVKRTASLKGQALASPATI